MYVIAVKHFKQYKTNQIKTLYLLIKAQQQYRKPVYQMLWP
jgi:hypothetical protein